MSKKALILIGVFLFIALVVMINILAPAKEKGKETSVDMQSLSQIGHAPMDNDTDNTNNYAPVDTNTQNGDITVAFYVEDKLRGFKTTFAGESVYPEEQPTIPNQVFQGWDVDLSEVWETTSTKPIFIDASELNNCFAIESAYCNEHQLATMNVVLCGNVCIASADFVIHYNAEELTLKDILDLDEGILTNHNPELGEIRCSLLSYDNITGSIDCMKLQFSMKETEERESAVTMIIEDASMLDGDDIMDAPTCVVDGKVFFLRELE